LQQPSHAQHRRDSEKRKEELEGPGHERWSA
jgi:hypothetical protein